MLYACVILRRVVWRTSVPCHLIQCVFSFLHQSKPCTNHAHTPSREACHLIAGRVLPLHGLTEQVTGAKFGENGDGEGGGDDNGDGNDILTVNVTAACRERVLNLPPLPREEKDMSGP